MIRLYIWVLSMVFIWSPAMSQQQNMAGVSFADLAEKLLPSVVNISTLKNSENTSSNLDITSANEHLRDYFLQDEGGRTSLGSGFIIDTKGYIVTNHHVIDDADEIIVKLSDGQQLDAKIIGIDKMTDIALIKIESPTPLPFVKMGNSDDLRVGDWILAIGNPFGLGGSVTTGIVSAKSRDIDAGSYDNFIQTDASINQGSSGGPMFNMQGEVVGINSAIFSSTGASMGIGFATPVNLSKFVIEQLMSKGKVDRGWIGVKVEINNQPIMLSDNQTFKGGVAISSISPNSPASKSGLEAGDVIISFNGNDIKDAKHFSRMIAESNIGNDIILRIWRNNQSKDLSLKIALMPETSSNLTSAPIDTEIKKPNGYIEDLGLVVEEKGNEIIVLEVLADASAAIQGIKSGDIIQKIDGKDVSSIEDLRSYTAYAKTAGGPPMEIRVLSDGLSQTVHLKVDDNE